VDQDRRPGNRRRDVWRGAGGFGGRCRVDAVEGGHQPLLRGDREEGGRADPLEDLDQRTAARLNPGRVRMADVEKTAKEKRPQQVYTLIVEVGRKAGDGLPDKATGAALMCYASG